MTCCRYERIQDEPCFPVREPRYSEIATFMRAPLADSFENLDIALGGVPTDLGVINRGGSRHGPREIRNAWSLMCTTNLAMRINPYERSSAAKMANRLEVMYADRSFTRLLGHPASQKTAPWLPERVLQSCRAFG